MKSPRALMRAIFPGIFFAFLAVHGAATTVVNKGALAEFSSASGLDLGGTISYAVNFSNNDPVLTVAGVDFTPDRLGVPGASFVTPNDVTPWQTKPDFTGPDDAQLEQLMEDIRWANSGLAQRLEAHFDVTPGALYKVQVLFSGNHVENRRWDILVEDETVVEDVTSNGAAPDGGGGTYSNGSAEVFSQTLTAGDSTLDVVFDGSLRAGAGIDNNPIWQAIIIKPTFVDTDNDGLFDFQEAVLGTNPNKADTDDDGLGDKAEVDLGSNPLVPDTDGDGMKDGIEVTLGLSPILADTDGDTIPDGAEDTDSDGLTNLFEINTSHTDPMRADTDGDGLTDGAEVNTYLTDPLDRDSDDDEYLDGFEVQQGANPKNASIFPFFSTQILSIRGGDVGEGLDLDAAGTADNNFVYAVNIGTNPPPASPIRGATFTADDATAGFTVAATAEIGGWNAPNFGSTPADDGLEQITTSIRYSGAPDVVTATMDNLEIGKAYKLQLIFQDQGAVRGFDIFLNGVLKADDFSAGRVQVAGDGPGAAFVHGFVAASTTLEVVLDAAGVSDPLLTDHNPILNGLTLEKVNIDPDSDGDGLLDDWERRYFGNTSQGADGDPDGDGRTNAQEFAADTNPTDPDTDHDGLNDSGEFTHGTNPNKADTDDDGLNDGGEIAAGTDPLDADSDNDCYLDGLEVAEGSNPNSASSLPVGGTFVTQVLGGDAGEDCLDLDVSGGSQFVYAVKIGSDPPPVDPVRDVTFTSDQDTPGFTISAINQNPLWNPAAFGDTPNDDVLEQVFASIRWAVPPSVVTLWMDNLEVGKPYKMQLLFGEACCQRGFDILVNDQIILDDFALAQAQGGTANPNPRGVAVVHGFVANSSTVKVVLDGRFVANPSILDHNPIINGVTLEKLTVNPDPDGDGLPDYWEHEHFGNTTSQTGTGDPDGDGLNNLGEFLAGSDPNDPDSDGDTLNDGFEVLTSHSSPVLTDTDGDGLSDAAEVNTHHTDPTKVDTDGDCLSDSEEINAFLTNPLNADSDSDGFKDGIEALITGTNPNDAASKPPSAVLSGLVCGGDEGEGDLDLKGNFVYAFNVGPNGGAGQIQDANFTDDAAPGITVTAVNSIPNFSNFNFGPSSNDARLKIVMDSIRWEPNGAVTVDLDGIEPGATYKLQVLFGEGCCPARGEDIIVEDVTVFHNFITGPAQGGQGNGFRGSVVAYEFVAPDDVLNIRCDGPAADDPSIADHNAILSGITLEKLSGGGAGFAITQITKVGTSVTLNFRGKSNTAYAVDFSSDLAAWAEVTDAAATGAGGSGSFVDTLPVRTGALRGYYRVRDMALKPNP